MIKLSFPKSPEILVVSIIIAVWIWAYVKSQKEAETKDQDLIFKNYHVIPTE